MNEGSLAQGRRIVIRGGARGDRGGVMKNAAAQACKGAVPHALTWLVSTTGDWSVPD